MLLRSWPGDRNGAASARGSLETKSAAMKSILSANRPLVSAGMALLLLGRFLGIPLAARADALEEWTTVAPGPIESGVRDVAFGNGLFILIGNRGNLWTLGQAGHLVFAQLAVFVE